MRSVPMSGRGRVPTPVLHNCMASTCQESDPSGSDSFSRTVIVEIGVPSGWPGPRARCVQAPGEMSGVFVKSMKAEAYSTSVARGYAGA
jgi:hypothetical protein